MDSEDDMHDANDGSEVYDSEGFAMDEDDEEDYLEEEEEDYGFVENCTDDDSDEHIPISRRPQMYYTILSEQDIRERQEEAVENVSSVLSISKVEAGILLRHFKWSVSKVNDEWFVDEAKVRREVGLLEKPAVEVRPDVKELQCGICFDTYSRDRMKAAVCGHHFCNGCWTGYIHTSVNDGPGCLSLRCPVPSCGAAVDENMVLSLVSDEDRKKYTRYLLRSYVEDNRKTKWCPAPGCEYGVDFVIGSGCYDITCKCSHNFCYNCSEEAHRPVDCETVEKWILKNSAESENMNWILANSKPCPKCKRPIEKNQGCMHITCTPPCKFEFCWLCLGAWSEHGERTGGFYACNRYETAKQEGVYDESERRREMAKNSLERYTHYYERWATNESSRAKALQDLQHMQAVQIEKLSDKQCQPVSQLKFVTDAWLQPSVTTDEIDKAVHKMIIEAGAYPSPLGYGRFPKSVCTSVNECLCHGIPDSRPLQIVECRRVLKWTYAYGYYLPEIEYAKRQFFEYLQGEAESGLERLHQCAEKELQGYIEGETAVKDFNDFRTKLAGLTSVTRNYFENLVQALENGLSDVNNTLAGAKGSSSKASASNKSRGRSKRGTDDTKHWY